MFRRLILKFLGVKELKLKMQPNSTTQPSGGKNGNPGLFLLQAHSNRRYCVVKLGLGIEGDEVTDSRGTEPSKAVSDEIRPTL